MIYAHIPAGIRVILCYVQTEGIRVTRRLRTEARVETQAPDRYALSALVTTPDGIRRVVHTEDLTVTAR